MSACQSQVAVERWFDHACRGVLWREFDPLHREAIRARPRFNTNTNTKKIHQDIPLIKIGDLRKTLPLGCVSVELVEGAQALPNTYTQIEPCISSGRRTAR